MQRPRHGPRGARDRRHDVRPRRGDHPRGERGGIHAVLRREDQIALEGEHPIGRRPHSLQHPEVVRRMAEGRVGIDRRVAGAQAPERGHEGREDRRDAERLVLGFARVPLVPGSDAPGRARAGDGRLEHRHERAAPAREVTEEVAVEREIPQANGLPRKGVVRPGFQANPGGLLVFAIRDERQAQRRLNVGGKRVGLPRQPHLLHSLLVAAQPGA